MAHDVSTTTSARTAAEHDGEAPRRSSARSPSSIEKETRLVRIARDQHGVVSRQQALEVGLSSSTIHRRTECGRWTRLLPGVYRLGIAPSHLEWASAALLAVGDAVLSHSSAARIRGWIDGPRSAPTHLSSSTRQPGMRSGIVVHRVVALSPDEEALSAAQLDSLLTRYRGYRGVAPLRVVLGQPGGPRFTRSEAEVRFLDLVRSAELPLPRTNLRVGPYELDAAWPRERVAVEIDGYEYHRSRIRFEADRRKDAWLAAKGYQVIRITWRHLTEHAIRTAAQVAQALARAGSILP